MTQHQAAAELGLGLNFSLADVKKAYKRTALAWSVPRPCRVPREPGLGLVRTFSRQTLD